LVVEQSLAHRVPAQARGKRLDQHLAAAFPDLTRARLKSLIDAGLARVDGKAAKPSRRLRGGESIELTVPPLVPAKPVAQDLPLEVLYEDRDIIVVNKPAGMVVHPAAGHWEGTLVNALLHRIRDLAGVGGELRPGLVHRLDKNTSGCIVVAKSEQVLAALQRAFKLRQVAKTYLAIVHGHPANRATLNTFFGRHPMDRKRFTGRVSSGKSAVTAFEVREQFERAALLEVTLHTGRTHQIRVHLAEAGHPLLGDALYGRRAPQKSSVGRAELELGRQALHAWKLGLAHPRTGAALAFEAAIPGDFRRALEVLRCRC
jgi:23S rRNA pseudouridine1911/1915/1917 synthase